MKRKQIKIRTLKLSKNLKSFNKEIVYKNSQSKNRRKFQERRNGRYNKNIVREMENAFGRLFGRLGMAKERIS